MARTVPEWIGKNDDATPPQSVRLRVLEKQGFRCADPDCGIDITHRRKHLDHRVRLKDGGGNRESNLQFLCVLCHANKTSGENKVGAKAARIQARHFGVKQPSQMARQYAKLKLTWKKNWKTGRMEKRITEIENGD